jgi:hypothetical protein
MRKIGRGILVAAICVILAVVAVTVCVSRLNVALERALDTVGSLQVRYLECEGDRLKLQTAFQVCNTGVESLSLSIETSCGSKLLTEAAADDLAKLTVRDQ